MKPTQDEPIATPGAPSAPETSAGSVVSKPTATPVLPREIGGRDGPEPTRFGDWEKAGRCIDF